MEFSYKITWINKMGELLLLYTLFLERILYKLNMKIDSFSRETLKKNESISLLTSFYNCLRPNC